MLLATDGITIGEKWTTVLPSKIDIDFFNSVMCLVVIYGCQKPISHNPSNEIWMLLSAAALLKK